MLHETRSAQKPHSPVLTPTTGALEREHRDQKRRHGGGWGVGGGGLPSTACSAGPPALLPSVPAAHRGMWLLQSLEASAPPLEGVRAEGLDCPRLRVEKTLVLAELTL